MKKGFLAALLVLLLLAVGAAADQKAVLDTADELEVTLTAADDIAISVTDFAGVQMTMAARDGLAPVRITVRPIEIEEGAETSLADLPEAEIAAFENTFRENYTNPKIERLTTEAGNLYIKICANEEADVDELVTIYRGYVMDLIQYNDDLSPITQADEAFCREILQGIWLTEKEAQ